MNLSGFFRPKLAETLRSDSSNDFSKDLIAGLTVGIVALPLAMRSLSPPAFLPRRAFSRAVIAGFIISSLGGTKVCIGGPTGAFVVILYGIYAKYGAENLAICTIMAGIILLVMGFSGLGTMIRFIPYPVTRDSRAALRS